MNLEHKNTNQPWLIVINPTSGSGRAARQIPKIEKAFTDFDIPFTIRQTTKRGDATQIVKTAVGTEGYRNIIGIGGDGTCNEIINGLMNQTEVSLADIRYTMYAAGTGNDWVKMHNIPSDLKAFCQMILRGRYGYQDIGMVRYWDNEGEERRKYFANAGGLGYDSFVVQSVEGQTERWIPKKMAYFFHIFRCLMAYKSEMVRVVVDEQVIESQFYTLNFGINKFAGAGMQLTPQAIKDDGLLALTLIKNLPRWKVIYYTPRLYSGGVINVPEAQLFNAKSIKIEHVSSPIFCETDGEFIGATPVEISILEQKLTVVVQ
ncbi:MAG: diacylglycerol kinase family lipid kinase [Saprospiraceae bacterium]|nr:diacylglycerol kinase family lipid kinase [Saprospiraceae bacterium]